jgi:hypothetical protein
MKMYRHIIIVSLIFTGLIIVLNSCSDTLNEPVHSQLSPDNFLNTKGGIKSTLANAYTKAANMNGNEAYRAIAPEMFTTGDWYQTGGGDNALAKLMLNFTWSPSDNNTFVYDNWGSMWPAIRNCNIIIENVDKVAGMLKDQKEEIKGEARFVRAYAYYKLWNDFGPLPIRTSTEQPLELPRASKKKFQDFMESQLLAAIKVLPKPGNELNYGRANKGAARALLTIWYLNTYQWKKSADMAKTIIDNGYYHLVPDYNQMFALDNERNSGFIWVQPALANQGGAHNSFLGVLFPPGIKKTVDFKYSFTFSGWADYASQFRLTDSFVNSFAPNDQRQDRILKKYINNDGDTINLMKTPDDARGIKFPPDPNAHGDLHGNDFPYIRYAAVLLARAEALNNIQGPNSESIELINKIRTRAGLKDVKLSDYHSKEALNNEILEERQHEFWEEGKRRRTLIRMGKFIKFARQRGISNAVPHDTLFPLSQPALDANPKLKQTPGY